SISPNKSSRLSAPGFTTTWLSSQLPGSVRENTFAPKTRRPTSASSGSPLTTVRNADFAASILVLPPPAPSAIDPEESNSSIVRWQDQDPSGEVGVAYGGQ